MRMSLSAVTLSFALGARALARPAAVAGPGPGVEIRDTSSGAVDTPSSLSVDDFRVKLEMELGFRAGLEAEIADLGKLLGARRSGEDREV